MTESRPSGSSRTITVRVPIAIKRRGGRKLVIAPDVAQSPATACSRHIDSALVKAIARAFRWRDMLESGEYSTIREIAAAEKINETYVGRILRLTLLAPEIVEAIQNGRQPVGLTLKVLMRKVSVAWQEQMSILIVNAAAK